MMNAKIYLGMAKMKNALMKPFKNCKGDDGSGEKLTNRAMSLVGLAVIIALVAAVLVFASGKANSMFNKVKESFNQIESLMP